VPFTEYVGFCLVWLALAVLIVDGLRAQRRRANPAAVPPAADVATRSQH
jgi:hypothetical protein